MLKIITEIFYRVLLNFNQLPLFSFILLYKWSINFLPFSPTNLTSIFPNLCPFLLYPKGDFKSAPLGLSNPFFIRVKKVSSKGIGCGSFLSEKNIFYKEKQESLPKSN